MAQQVDVDEFAEAIFNSELQAAGTLDFSHQPHAVQRRYREQANRLLSTYEVRNR